MISRWSIYAEQLKSETESSTREGRTVEVVRTCQEKTTVSTSKRVKALVVDGLRKNGRLKLRWDRVKHDMEEFLLFEDTDRN
ncbi:hypothetical protein Tco_1018538 [Tanacetum coccineum]|uniref:Uncharacterized protein n=1 Tax=Tanacetum coccineum TaxID=301880 RepID=A0ABQ5FW15_9ASTR